VQFKLLITVFNRFLCSFTVRVDISPFRQILLREGGDIGNRLEAVNLKKFQSTKCVESLGRCL